MSKIAPEELIDNVFENFKKITPALIAACSFSGLLLFLPTSLLEKLGLSNIVNSHRPIIGIVFTLSLVLIVVITLSALVRFISKSIKQRCFLIAQKKKLRKLSPRQKWILCELLNSADKAIRLDCNSGDTLYLMSNLFIYAPAQVFSIGSDNKFEEVFVPQPWLIELFQNKPDLFR